MSFVTEWSSYCIYMIKSNGSAEGILFLHGFHARSDMHAPLTQDYLICNFQTGTRFIFSLQDTKIVSEWQFHWDWKPGWTHSFWIDLYGNKMSFWYHVHVNKYRDMMEMEWTCSRMKVTLVSCQLPVRGGYYKRVKLNYYPFPKRWKIRLERGGLAL